MSKKPPKSPPGKSAGKNAPEARPAKANPILIVLWALSFWFLYRTFNQPTVPTGPAPTTEALHTQLVNENAKLLEVSATNTNKDYQTALDADLDKYRDLLKKKSITELEFSKDEDEINTKRVEAGVLVADAYLRAAKVSGKYDKLNQAYQVLEPLKQKDDGLPAWTTTEYHLSGATGDRTWTASALHDNVVTELSAQNKTALVYGVIPGFQFIDLIVRATGSRPDFSYWFTALLLAAGLRAILWPLSQRQLMWSRQMAQLTPLVKEIKDRYKNDQAETQKKTMELYKEYGINPAAGCIPALVQMPFFLAIYQCMLQYRFEFRKGTFAWINSDFAQKTHHYTAANLGETDKLLIIIYAVSLLISTMLTPVTDPSNAKQQRIMGVFFALFFPIIMYTGTYALPSAFVLYWTFTNVIVTAQSLRAYRLPVPPLVKVLTSVGGAIALKPAKVTWWDRLQEQTQAQMDARTQAAEQVIKDKEAKGSGGRSNGAAKKDVRTSEAKSTGEETIGGAPGGGENIEPQSPTNGFLKGETGKRAKPKRRIDSDQKDLPLSE